MEESASLTNTRQPVLVGEFICPSQISKRSYSAVFVKAPYFSAVATVLECASNGKSQFYARLSMLLAGRRLGYNTG